MLGLCVVFCGVLTVSGCLIFDTSDVPEFPQRRPVLLTSEARPRAFDVLREFPAEIVVPVELNDGRQNVEYRVFYNYSSDPKLARAPDVLGVNVPEADKTTNSLRVIRVALPRPSDLSACIRIELLVAAAFEGRVSGVSAHTALPPGGDSLAWVYEPLGSIGCGTPTEKDAPTL